MRKVFGQSPCVYVQVDNRYVERTNLRSRMAGSALLRRNPAPARKAEKVEHALELSRLIYNFVRGHSSKAAR